MCDYISDRIFQTKMMQENVIKCYSVKAIEVQKISSMSVSTNNNK